MNVLQKQCEINVKEQLKKYQSQNAKNILVTPSIPPGRKYRKQANPPNSTSVKTNLSFPANKTY